MINKAPQKSYFDYGQDVVLPKLSKVMKLSVRPSLRHQLQTGFAPAHGRERPSSMLCVIREAQDASWSRQEGQKLPTWMKGTGS